jgi:hypothetical protein
LKQIVWRNKQDKRKPRDIFWPEATKSEKVKNLNLFEAEKVFKWFLTTEIGFKTEHS